MKTKSSNIKTLFVSGHIQKVYKLFLKDSSSEENFTWTLGALCLLGKLDEALLLIKKKKLISADYFFLITASTRNGQHELSKKWFRELSKKSTLNEENKFFYYQAMAFYAFYKCRYKNCLTLVKRSRDFSLGLNEPFWKILSLDLLGHTYVQLGNVYKGFSHLEEAHDLASLLGNKTFQQATKISIINYQAHFTDNPRDHLKIIEKCLRLLSKNDNYSEGSLLLSLAHLNLLTGQMNQADKALNNSQKIIFSSSTNRHKSMWCFEKSYFYFLEGSYDLALTFLSQSEEFCNFEIEKKLIMKILGLRKSIYTLLKKNTAQLDSQLIQIAKIVGDPVSINKLARLNLLKSESTEDPLQHLFDKFNGPDWKQSLPHILSSAYYGLLREKLPDRKKSYIITGLWPKGILIMRPDSIYIKENGVSELLMKALIKLSSQKIVSKEEIVKYVWGYDYDPSRHDTSIYSLIHRIREILGPIQKDLISEGHSYKLLSDFNHIDLSPTLVKETTKINLLHSGYKSASKWNIRQYKALEMINTGKTFKVSEYALEFKISVITALRDLSELKEARVINVYGKARATTYAQ